MTNKKKKFTIPLYGNDLIVIQTDDLSKVQRKYHLEDVTDMDGITFVSEDKNGFPRYVIAFEGKTTAGIIAHEALHIVVRIYQYVHAELDMHNEEPQNYLLGWIVDQVHSVVKLKKI